MPSFAELILQASARAWLEILSAVLLGALNRLAPSHATKRWTCFSTFAHRAPYVSGILIFGFGVDVGYQGWTGLSAQAAPAASETASAGG
jgi:ABC-type nickel/cobalt efflux system permease component RcnA